MICIYCGKRIEYLAEKDSDRSAHSKCLSDHWGKPGLKNFYCSSCGTILPKMKHKNGFLNTNTKSELCPSCRIMKQMKIDMAVLEKCRAEKIAKSSSIITKKNNDSRLNWRKKNSHKEWAAVTARKNADNLTILYECSCNNGSPKEKHHHDYTKPLEVMLLCHACHMKWHSRIRNQSSPALPDTTAQVIDTCIGCGGQAGDQTQ